MKKQFILFLFIIATVFIIFSCKKEIFKSEFKGTVKHYYTKQPISGIPIQLYYTSGSGILSSTENVAISITDNNGEFSFTLKKYRSGSYEVKPFKYTKADSTKNEWKFVTEGEFQKIDKNIHPEFLLKPSGDIWIGLNSQDWVTLNADTFVIETNNISNITRRSTNSNINSTEFWIEPSQYHKFIWYGLKNGEKVYYEEKFIFVPNAYFYKLYPSDYYCKYGYGIYLLDVKNGKKSEVFKIILAR